MSRLNKILFSFLTLTFIGAESPPQTGLKDIAVRLKTYTQYRPQQKIYIQTDKPLYAPGEDIWFSLYMVNAQSHKSDSISNVIYVELFNSTSLLLQRLTLYSTNGFSNGAIHLADDLKSGSYLIRSYTNYMKNAGEDYFFTKEITVAGQLMVSSEESDKVDLDAQFFPEGGNLLRDVENRVAFKIIDSHGYNVSAQGDILDENNIVVCSFKTEHQGMGIFKITPHYGHKYHAQIKSNDQNYTLPDVLEKGYILRVLDFPERIRVIAYSNVRKFTNKSPAISILAQCRGEIIYTAEGSIPNTTTSIDIPKNKFPSGITQITLFDDDGIPQCERLVFINHQKTLHFSVTPDHDNYSSRQEAKLNIQVTDATGTPAEGNFSMSVYDESVIAEPKPYPNSINASLLLTSDLKGRIDEPGYYLKDTLPQTKSDLDLLMMTHGWRRFTWKKILSDTISPEKYYPEHGIVISGKLQKTFSKQPSVNSTVKILSPMGGLAILMTDSTGTFYSDNLIYYDSTNLFIQTDNAKGKQSDLKFMLDPFNIPPPFKFEYSGQRLIDAKKFIDQTAVINQILKASQGVTILNEVEVKAKKEEVNQTTKLYGIADATIKMDNSMQSYTNVLQAIQGRVAGVSISGNPPTVSIRGGGEPLFLLDGMQVDNSIISSIAISSIESIDVLKGVSASIYGGRGGNGVIAIYTKRGGAVMARASIGSHTIKYPGFYKTKEFYSPHYDKPSTDDHSDIRNTQYWNPTIKTNKDGQAQVNFYTSDTKGSFKVIIEGISKQGQVGTGASLLEVR